MYWGAGSALGVLTLLGYLAFTVGAALIWRNRSIFYVWADDEFGAVRRSLSRYTVIGPFYGRREEPLPKVVALQCLTSLSRFPRRHVHAAFVLLSIGVVLFFLDFFI